MKKRGYDFSGWATKNNLRCSDGRTIRKGAFSANSGKTVPLVWNHRHESPDNVLGHALLEERDEGIYAYCKFNDTEAGRNAKQLVRHGDVTNLSIYANQLKQKGADVLHGAIREVSLVLAGANPGAFIDAVLEHGEGGSGAVIYTDEDLDFLEHGYDPEDDEEDEEDEYDEEDDELEHADEEGGETLQDVFNTLSDKQKKAVYAMIALAVEDNKGGSLKHADDEEDGDDSDDGEETMEDVFNTLSEKQKKVVYAMIALAVEDSKGGDESMKHNVFDTDEMQEDNYLSHSDMQAIFADAKRCGSLREAVDSKLDGGVLMHATTVPTDRMEVAKGNQKYGFNDPNMLFPEYRSFQTTPEWISRDMEWVSKVMSSVHHSPFSRVKSVYANITEDEARAKGYLKKGTLKKEEVFSLLKRTTDPQTIYKKQKMDRDDIIDITDFDVVAWIKAEMRVMLNEEIARAILIGDGRLPSDDDHISEEHVRPIWKEADLFAVKVPVSVPASAAGDENARAKAIVRAIIKARKNYKGSGEPTFFTTEDMLTDMLLIEDGVGRLLYPTVQQLATTLRVKEIVPVEVMENQVRESGGKNLELLGIIVNLRDYNVGADKGGAINMFEDFDIDYNQEKYLIETRISGALIKPFSALVLEMEQKTSGGGTTTNP